MTTKTFRIALLSLALFAVPAGAEPMNDNDRYEMLIDAGRVEVMVQSVRDVLPTIKAPDRPAPADTPANMRALIFTNLLGAVLEYNALAFRACHDGIVDGALCSGPYVPAWLTANPTALSDEQIHSAVREAMDRIQPFWSAVCSKAPERTDGAEICPME